MSKYTSHLKQHGLLAIVTVAIFCMVLISVNMAAATTTTECIDGMAGEYACHNVHLLANLPLEALGGDAENAVLANDIWGWTSPTTGIEYALVGLRNATAFVDISDPVNPVYLGSLPAHQDGLSDYRDIKVYQDYAFIVADVPYDAHGMQVFDLAELDSADRNTPMTFAEAAHYDGIAYGHNLWINEATGFAYIYRSDTCEAATHMVDINDPLNPVTAGSGDGCYISNTMDSDAECIIYDGPDTDYAGREICVTGSDESVTIGDVTDKDNPLVINVFTYPNVHRAHQGSFTIDRNYVLISDTMDEMMLGFDTRTHLIDVHDLDNPVYLGFYQHDTSATDHNVYIPEGGAYLGEFAVETNWRSGLRILNITTIPDTNWEEVAYFDTYPENDNVGAKSGSWSSYPWFGSGVIAVSDVERGLFLLYPVLRGPTAVSLDAFLGEQTTQWPLVIVLLGATALIGGAVVYRRRMR